MKYFLLITILVTCVMCSPNEEEEKEYETKQVILVGTYTKKEGHVDGKGSGLVVLNASNDYSVLYEEKSLVNPTFFDVSTDGKYIYTVNETGPDVSDAGTVSSFELLENGELLHLTTQSSMSFYPCHITLAADDQYAIASNYAGGVVVYPIDNMHQLEEASQTLFFEGGTDHPRQDGSHPHSTSISPQGYVYIADLGTNRIMMFNFINGNLVPLDTPYLELAAGAGPRHMAFHPTLPYAYVINELNSTITQLTIAENGILEIIESINTLPEDFEGENSTADIHITQDGKFLYGSNRGQNSIAMYAIDAQGELELLGHESVRGEVPRNFMISDDQLWVANQNTDNVVVFDIQKDGLLLFSDEIKIGTPVCLRTTTIGD